MAPPLPPLVRPGLGTLQHRVWSLIFHQSSTDFLPAAQSLACEIHHPFTPYTTHCSVRRLQVLCTVCTDSKQRNAKQKQKQSSGLNLGHSSISSPPPHLSHLCSCGRGTSRTRAVGAARGARPARRAGDWPLGSVANHSNIYHMTFFVPTIHLWSHVFCQLRPPLRARGRSTQVQKVSSPYHVSQISLPVFHPNSSSLFNLISTVVRTRSPLQAASSFTCPSFQCSLTHALVDIPTTVALSPGWPYRRLADKVILGCLSAGIDTHRTISQPYLSLTMLPMRRNNPARGVITTTTTLA